MKCIIIDDEVHCIGTLEILLNRIAPEIEIVATCSSGAEGIMAIKKFRPQLVFLDISMPKMNGFEMLSQIQDLSFKVIFTTAYDNFAIKAFKVSAVDYLLKPIDAQELSAAIEKVNARMISEQSHATTNFLRDQMELFLENVQQSVQVFPNVAVPTLEGMEMVAAESIIYVESDSNYATCFFEDGRSLMVSKTLKYMEELLAQHNFVRIHRSYLINVNHMTRYIKGEGGYVIMDNNQKLDVSRRRKDELMQLLKR